MGALKGFLGAFTALGSARHKQDRGSLTGHSALPKASDRRLAGAGRPLLPSAGGAHRDYNHPHCPTLPPVPPTPRPCPHGPRRDSALPRPCGCRNVPTGCGLKQQNVFSLGLEAGGRGVPLGGSRKGPSCLVRLLGAPGVPGPLLCVHLAISSLLLSAPVTEAGPPDFSVISSESHLQNFRAWGSNR